MMWPPVDAGTPESEHGALRNWPRSRGLLRLDVGRPDHLAPLPVSLDDELAKLGGRAGKHRGAEVGDPCLHFGVGKGGIDLLVELSDDLGGCVPWRPDAVPGTRLVARHEIAEGWDVRQHFQARGSACGQMQEV